MLDKESISLEIKQILFELLELCYCGLSNFCKDNSKNQNILHAHIEIFMQNMYYDFGQANLICFIFNNNSFLCNNSSSLVNFFKNSIFKFGRQQRFLKFFLVKLIKIYDFLMIFINL